MKKTILIVFLLSSLLMACRKNSESPRYELGVTLQGAFIEDDVKLYIDGQPLFDGKAKTDLSIGIAGSIGTTNTEGNHTIKVIVNENTSVVEPFEQQGNLYISVIYKRADNKIEFAYSPTRKLYN